MRLTLGNKNYSSWSLRGWLCARAFNIPFEATTIWLDEPGSQEIKLAAAPTARVPVLMDGDLRIWDSLAIAEYLAEKFPDRGMWPEDVADRARARSLCAEMHSGFHALREHLPMNIRAQKEPREWSPEVKKDIDRIIDIWSERRGPFLFGAFCIADAFFAPVASRMRTYSVALTGEAAAYAETILAHPAMVEWFAEAGVEGHPMPDYD